MTSCPSGRGPALPPVRPPRRGGRALLRACGGATVALALAGCASFSADGGFDRVAALTRERTGQSPAWQRGAGAGAVARARIAELLGQPLTAEAAVEIALLNNRSLQARFGELGVAEADRVRAGRLANPVLGVTRIGGGGIVEIDRSVMFDLLGLLTLPVASELGQARFEQAQLQAASDAVGLAGDARKAFFAAVASQDLLKYAGQVKDAADASGELARRMREAGNFSRLADLRQQAFLADANGQLARARHQAVADRERLVRLLGLSGDQLDFRLIDRLPDLPAAPADPVATEQAAMSRRLDVLMARRDTEATARALGLTRATRFVNVLEAGYADKRQTGDPSQAGVAVQLELPLFDAGSTRAARAEALYLQAVDRTAALAVDARSEVRERYSAYRTAYDLARQCRDETVPLKKRISDENLLRYNGMLIGVFDLLADAREQVASVTGCVEALRDHWLALSELQSALTGGDAEPQKASR